jgi:hypothetical protein
MRQREENREGVKKNQSFIQKESCVDLLKEEIL